MTITAKQIDDCRRLAFTIAPELSGRPLYIVDTEIFADLLPNRDCFGWATKNDPHNSHLTDEISEYTEPGPIIAINSETILREYGEHFERCLRSVLVHELAHILPSAAYCDDEPTYTKEFQLACMLESWAAPAPSHGEPGDPHDWRFLRRLVHLYSRAAAAGCDMPFSLLLSGGQAHWQAPVGAYLLACQGEILRMRDEDFAAIESEKPPADLVALWKNDLQNYERYCT